MVAKTCSAFILISLGETSGRAFIDFSHHQPSNAEKPFVLSYTGRCTHERRSVYARTPVGVRTYIGRCTPTCTLIKENLHKLLD